MRTAILGSYLTLLASLTTIAAQEKPATDQVPKEVRALVGAYVGEWVMNGVNDKGEIVKQMAWTDKMTATNAEVVGGRAQVATVDEMTFEGGKIPPFKVTGKEGYHLHRDGSLGDYFIETMGVTNRMVKVADDVWSYVAVANAQELTRMGFPKGASGKHVLVKVLTKEQGAETHRISRLTTVQWKDKEGKERTLQFVSLQGYHRRQP